MRSSKIENILIEEKKKVFDITSEKNDFLKRLYSSGIVPPQKIITGSLFPIFNKDNSVKAMNYACACLVILGSGLNLSNSYIRNDITLNSPVLAAITISDNKNKNDEPLFEMSFNTEGKVERITASNDNAKIAIGQSCYIKELDLNKAVNYIFDSTVNTYYLDVNATKDNPNNINVLFYGEENDVAKIKKRIGKSFAEYMKDNYIYANFYDCRESSNSQVLEYYRNIADEKQVSLAKCLAYKSIHKYLSCFDENVTLDETIEQYENYSYDDLVMIKNNLATAFVRIKAGKEISEFKEQFIEYFEKYKEIKNANFNEWKVKFMQFLTEYSNAQEMGKENLDSIEFEKLCYEEYSIFQFADVLSKNVEITDSMKKFDNIKQSSKKGLDQKYYEFKETIKSYIDKENQIIENINNLLRVYSKEIDCVIEKQREVYVTFQADREKIDDKRNEDFYVTFKEDEANLFNWN